MPTLRERLRQYTSTKPGFMRFGTIAFGGLMAIFMLWFVGSHGGLFWWLFIVAVCVGAGWLWSCFMWLVVKDDIERVSSQLDDQGLRANPNDRNGT